MVPNREEYELCNTQDIRIVPSQRVSNHEEQEQVEKCKYVWLMRLHMHVLQKLRLIARRLIPPAAL